MTYGTDTESAWRNTYVAIGAIIQITLLRTPAGRLFNIRCGQWRKHGWFLGIRPILFLTPSTPALPDCCCSKRLESYGTGLTPPFLIFDIRALPNVEN